MNTNNCCPPIQHCPPVCGTFGGNRTAFILVLFILLVIVGCAFY